MFSMQCSSCLTYVENEVHGPNFLYHLQTSKIMKNDGRLRLYSTTDDKTKDTNTISYRKDGQSLMQHGNPPCVSKMVVKKYTKNINANANYIYKWTCHHAQQRNPDNHLHISRGRSGWPSYFGPNHSIYLTNSTTTSHIDPTHRPQSIYDIQRCIKRNFYCSTNIATTYPTSSHSIWIDIPPVKNFSSKFTHHPSNTLPSPPLYHGSPVDSIGLQ